MVPEFLCVDGKLTLMFLKGLCTCSRTLAVSRGKVRRSAMQAAVPALTNFTATDGGTSAGPNPTIFKNYFDQYQEESVAW